MFQLIMAFIHVPNHQADRYLLGFSSYNEGVLSGTLTGATGATGASETATCSASDTVMTWRTWQRRS